MSADKAATIISNGYRSKVARLEVQQLDAERKADALLDEKEEEVHFPTPEELVGTYLLSGRFSAGRIWPQLITWELSSAAPFPCKQRPALWLTQRVLGRPCGSSYLCLCNKGLYASPVSCFPCVMIYSEDEVGVCCIPLLVHDGRKASAAVPARSKSESQQQLKPEVIQRA